MPLLADKLKFMEEEEGKRVMVVFPDEGASKRFRSDLPNWPAITCVKVKNGDTREVTIKDGE